MPTYRLEPGHLKTFTDTQGGSDLVVRNPGSEEGKYTFVSSDDPSEEHTIAPGGSDAYEVADGQRGTVDNKGNGPLTIDFPDQ